MPPISSFDAPRVGPTFLLKEDFDEETCEIRQRVRIGVPIDKSLFRDLEMAAYDLEMPPRIVQTDQVGEFDCMFDPDTDEETIPDLIKLLLEHLSDRLKRHEQFLKTGPALAMCGELDDHLRSRSLG